MDFCRAVYVFCIWLSAWQKGPWWKHVWEFLATCNFPPPLVLHWICRASLFDLNLHDTNFLIIFMSIFNYLSCVYLIELSFSAQASILISTYSEPILLLRVQTHFFFLLKSHPHSQWIPTALHWNELHCDKFLMKQIICWNCKKSSVKLEL